MSAISESNSGSEEAWRSATIASHSAWRLRAFTGVRTHYTVEQSASRLVDVVWADSPPESARALIQTYVSTLRNEAIEVTVLNPGGSAAFVAACGTRVFIDIEQRRAGASAEPAANAEPASAAETAPATRPRFVVA